jgi:hypothetical protein
MPKSGYSKSTGTMSQRASLILGNDTNDTVLPRMCQIEKECEKSARCTNGFQACATRRVNGRINGRLREDRITRCFPAALEIAKRLGDAV